MPKNGITLNGVAHNQIPTIINVTVLRDSLSSGREIVLSKLKFHINFFLS